MGRWGGIAAVGLVVLLAVAVWFGGSGRRVGPALHVAPGSAEALGAGEELVTASVLHDESGGATRLPVRADAALPRGRLRGRLTRAEDGGPLPVRRIVVLACDGNGVAETVRSEEDGCFTTEREFPRGLVRAFVRDPESGDALARHEARFDPEAGGEWLVPVPTRPSTEGDPDELEEGETRLRGEVADLSALPVARAVVKLIPLDAGDGVMTATTDPNGQFELTGLVPGRHVMLAQGRFASTPRIELVLDVGWNDAGRVCLPALPAAGPIGGRLVAEGGSDPWGFLVLRDLESGKETVISTDFDMHGSGEEDESTFEFPAVPAGRYELVLFPMDGRTYEPARLEVEPPAQDLVFRSEGAQGAGHVLHVTAAESRSELPFVVLMGIHDQWFADEVSSGESDDWPLAGDWIVVAEGRRPARGRFPEPLGGGASAIRIEVPLEPGWGDVLLFKDVASDRLLASEFDAHFAPGLAGVVVLADGRPVATSDATGLVLLDLARGPERVEFRHPGWRVLKDEQDQGIRLVQMVRE